MTQKPEVEALAIAWQKEIMELSRETVYSPDQVLAVIEVFAYSGVDSRYFRQYTLEALVNSQLLIGRDGFPLSPLEYAKQRVRVHMEELSEFQEDAKAKERKTLLSLLGLPERKTPLPEGLIILRDFSTVSRD